MTTVIPNQVRPGLRHDRSGSPVQGRRNSFYITATGGEDGLARLFAQPDFSDYLTSISMAQGYG